MAKKKNVNNVNNDVSPVMMISIVIIFIIAMIFVAYFGMNLTSPVNKYFSSYNNKVKNNLGELLKRQKEMDAKVKELSMNSECTFENPCVLERPYELNPLTALVIFNTDTETRVEVSINDEVKTNVERSKKHIVPVYGLYADSLNYIKLTLEDGNSRTIQIQQEAFDNNIYSFDVTTQIGDSGIYYMVGDLNKHDSKLRGFDKAGNLISYMSLDYIRGYSIYKNKLALAYNQNKDVPSDIRLDVDYMGRITYITSNTKDIKYEPNIVGEGVGFIGYGYDLYSDLIGNYTTPDLVNNDSYDMAGELAIDEYENRLTDSSLYKGDFKISYMSEFISYSIDQEARLLIVTNEGDLKYYSIKDQGIIKTNIKGNKALYIEVNGDIYSLRTTLMD